MVRAARGVHRPVELEPLRLTNLTDAAALAEGGPFDGLRFAGTSAEGVDLAGESFTECAFESLDAEGALWRGVRFSEVAFARVSAATWDAPRSVWRDVRVRDSRVGAAEFYGADLQRTGFDGCKLSYLNLRGSSLREVVFAGCVVDELDLGQATAAAVDFRDCTIGTLHVSHAKLTRVDLRGATLGEVHGLEHLRGAIISEQQCHDLAPLFAALHGVVVA